jgi:hypothetical protein
MPYYSAPFTFDFATSRIAVDSGVTDVDCIALYTAAKIAQASQEGIIYDRIAKGSGLSILGPDVQVGLTVELLGSWQLQFPAGNYIARVAGGNLIGGPGGDPIAYSAGVQTLLIQSAASTVVQGGGGGSFPANFANLLITPGGFIRNVENVGSLDDGAIAMASISDQAWDRIAASGGGGANAGTGSIICEFEVKDASTLAPVAGALITVKLNGALVAYSRTANNGILQFALDEGSHEYAVSATAYIQEFGTFVPEQGGLTLISLTRSEPVPPDPFVGLCNVLFAITHVGNPVHNARVTAELMDANPTVDNYLLSKQVIVGVTDANGECVLTLVQRGQFTRGGKYRIRAVDQLGKELHNRTVTIPNQGTVNAEDLPDA